MTNREETMLYVIYALFIIAVVASAYIQYVSENCYDDDYIPLNEDLQELVTQFDRSEQKIYFIGPDDDGSLKDYSDKVSRYLRENTRTEIQRLTSENMGFFANQFVKELERKESFVISVKVIQGEVRYKKIEKNVDKRRFRNLVKSIRQNER